MSLNVLQIPPAMADIWEEQVYTNPEIKNMVFATMAVGWGEISEENHIEWFLRLRSWELLIGAPLTPLETVKRYIGLRTNVFGKDPDHVFADHIRQVLLDRARHELRSSHGIDWRPVQSDDSWVITVDRYDAEYDDEEDESVADDAPRFTLRLYRGARKEESEDDVAPDELVGHFRRYAEIVGDY